MSEKAIGLSKNSYLKVNNILDIFFRDRMRSAALQAAALNHEFYTPLSIIKGIAEKVLKNPDQNMQNHLQAIVNESSRLLKELEKLSILTLPDYSKRHKVSLHHLVQETISFYENIFLKQGISVQLDIDDSIAIEVEPFRFKTIISALLQNSIESFESINKVVGKSITVHTQQNESQLFLILSDNGQGISEDRQRYIRSDILTNIENFLTGSQIGLAMACHLSEELQIDFDFVSEKHFGTSFTLTFKK